MGLKTLTTKSMHYYRQNGLLASLRRIPVKLRWTIFRKRDILFMCDLVKLEADEYVLPDGVTIERIENIDQVAEDVIPALFEEITQEMHRHQFRERFDQGSALWLCRIDGKIAGMIWTLAGATIETHYFCITESDVHYFNGIILKQYRGHGVLGMLIDYILIVLKKEGFVRAFLETNSANNAAIKAIGKTNVTMFATARKYRIFGRNVTIWNKQGLEQ